MITSKNSQLFFDFSNINTKYNIKDIILGEFNSDVYNYLFTLKDWQSKFLFIHGNKGVGKTFLSKIYINSKNGIHLSLNNIKDITYLDTILIKYSHIIIDDLINLTKDQEIILVNFYNQIQGLKHHKLIFISRLSQNDFTFNTNDLKSRFFSMISLQIKDPSDDFLKALFIKNLTDKQFTITKQMLDIIFTYSKRDCHTLISLANKIDNFLSTHNKKLTINIIKDIIHNNM